MRANLAVQGPLLVVADLMGTTLRDDGAVLPAYRTAFAECAIPFTEQELANWRGAHKLSLFTEFATRRYPADEAPKIAAAALEVFESQLRRFLAKRRWCTDLRRRGRDSAIARRGHQGGADQRLRPSPDRRHRRALRLGRVI